MALVGEPDADRRRELLREVALLWIGTLLLIRLTVDAVRVLGLHELFLAIVPILFIYAPVWWLQRKGLDPWDFPLHLPAFSDRPSWFGAFSLNIAFIAVILVPWLVGYHFWQNLVFGLEPELTRLPREPIKLIGYHLFFVAIPEEIFYRGYMQTRLDEVWPPRWNILGATLGWGWLVTCLVFALGHSLVQFQWWHIFIMFPSLVFGWMRARTGGIIAGAFFHAWSNITVSTLDTIYGVPGVDV